MKKPVFLLLLLVSLIAYGQILEMNFWQDDNAVVFKFTHLAEDAGYLGKGLLGEGPYRYTVTPYFYVFKLFGYNPLPYFALMLVFYIASVMGVYVLYLTIFEDRRKALVAGLLYAAGYVASDGFIRMFNSVLTSLTVLLVCGALGGYYKYYKVKKRRWYFWSLLMFVLALEIGYIRTHFFFFVVVAFELVFLFGERHKSVKEAAVGVLLSFLRIMPFYYFFYVWFLSNLDPRSQTVKVLVQSILKGEFYNLYSFLATFGNMLLSNEVFPRIYSFYHKFTGVALTEMEVIMGLIAVMMVVSLFLARQRLLSIKLAAASVFGLSISLIWAVDVFTYPGLIGGFNEKAALYAAIGFIFLVGVLLRALPNKKMTLFLFVWMVLNLAAYAAYIPIYAYPSDNRYLLFSFIPLVGLLSLWGWDLDAKLRNSVVRRVPLVLVLLWGGVNLYSSVHWQRSIVLHRSEPSKRFFRQLGEYVPSFEKGSVFYFYVPDVPMARAHYDAGFGVAQMPEETAIAWRYGVDRYDLKIVNTFEDLMKYFDERSVRLDNVYAFVAEPDDLVNVTGEARELLGEGKVARDSVNLEVVGMEPLVIEPKALVSTVTPVRLKLTMMGVPLGADEVEFPFEYGSGVKLLESREEREHYLDFYDWREDYYQKASVVATSVWKEFKAENLLDRDGSTYWEADRIEWDSKQEGFTIDLGEERMVGGVFLRKGPDSLTPTEFEIFVSVDGENYVSVKRVSGVMSQEGEIKRVVFDGVRARYVRVIFYDTLYDDSPGVSEAEVVAAEFSDIDPMVAQRFFREPFLRVESAEEWKFLMSNFKDKGLVRVSWQTDASEKMVTDARSTAPLVYDGREHEVEVEIAAGGRYLEKIEILPITIPGRLIVRRLEYQNEKLSEF